MAYDDFDATCKRHDIQLALAQSQADVLRADEEFFEANYGAGVGRTLSALAVYYLNPIMSKKSPALRGATSNKAKMVAKTKAASTQHNVPAAIGFTVRGKAPSIVKTSTGATIKGADYAGTVNVFNASTYEPAASVPMNPSYFNSAMLGNLSRVYEKYRFKRAVLEYIPSVPTSTQGQLVLLSDRSIKNPFLDGSSTSFLGRALSQANAVATPLWQRTTFECDVSQAWNLVDPLIDADLDDTIAGEVQVYGFADTTMVAGILMLHYEVEFKDPLYTFHPTLTPIPVGIGTLATFNDDSAVNNSADAIILTNSSITLGAFANGSVFRMVFQRAGSTAPAGPSGWSTVAGVQTTTATTTTTVAGISTGITMVTGTTLYGVLNGSTVTLYSSYDHAVTGSANGLLRYVNATTAVGEWSFIMAGVRLGASLMVTNQ